MATWTAGHALVAESFQQGRIFLGGDAVHLFTPTGGLGYNTALEDAVNLGWKLAAVLKGQAPAALLDSYERERKPLALRNTYVPTACPGGRPPHAWLDDGRSLFDSFNFEWTLLALGPDAPDATPFATCAGALSLDLTVVKQASPLLLDLYEAPLVLIRPDQIVAWRGHDASAAAQVMAQVTGRWQMA